MSTDERKLWIKTYLAVIEWAGRTRSSVQPSACRDFANDAVKAFRQGARADAVKP